jgi:hypothetical protein
MTLEELEAMESRLEEVARDEREWVWDAIARAYDREGRPLTLGELRAAVEPGALP